MVATETILPSKDSQMDIVALFCEIDDFCQVFEPWPATQLLPARQRQRQTTMHLSEVMTILVLFHWMGMVDPVSGVNYSAPR